DEAPELRLELRLREPRGGEQGREIGADLRGVAADLTGAREVVAVGRLVVGSGAALDPDREQDDDEDSERDEPRQTEQGRDPMGRRELRSARSATASATARRAAAGGSSTRAGRRRDLARLVVDEVEIEDVVVVHGHRQTPAEPVALDVRSNPFSGRVYGRFGG